MHFFVNQRVFISSREQTPIFTFFKKSNSQNDLNIPLHQKAAHRNSIINGFSFAEFCVTRAKLHFGEFSNLTFQAVSRSLLFLFFEESRFEDSLSTSISYASPRPTTTTKMTATGFSCYGLFTQTIAFAALLQCVATLFMKSHFFILSLPMSVLF